MSEDQARQAAADLCGMEGETHVHSGECARWGFDAGVAWERERAATEARTLAGAFLKQLLRTPREKP